MIQKIIGEVIHGKKLGRKIGYPTANISLKKGNIEDGTYKINIVIGNQLFQGAGVYRENIELFEAHIFDFNKNIYGKTIEIYVIEKIRENKRVSNLEEVKQLIDSDVDYIQSHSSYVMTFGTFDVVHQGHEYYLDSAKKYGDRLVTIVATDKNVEKFKGTKPRNNEEKRKQDVKSLGISDIVSIGGEMNHLDWIQLYNPKVICLGYDQIGFSNELQKHIKQNKLEIEIVRIPPYKPETYKSSKIKQNKIKDF